MAKSKAKTDSVTLKPPQWDLLECPWTFKKLNGEQLDFVSSQENPRMALRYTLSHL